MNGVERPRIGSRGVPCERPMSNTGPNYVVNGDDVDNFVLTSEALHDLQRALEITEGKKTRARALTLCQQGVLLRKKGSDDEAKKVFEEAAKLGSGFAKKQASTTQKYYGNIFSMFNLCTYTYYKTVFFGEKNRD